MSRTKKLISGTFLIFGTTVGAGMLGIPAMTGGVGFIPAILLTFLVWLFVLATGFLLIEATLHMQEGANLVSLSAKFLGKNSKWVITPLFLLFYGSLLVAYFAGGAPLVGEMGSFLGISLSFSTQMTLFVLVFGGLIFLGARWITFVNLLFGIGMLATYAILLFCAGSRVDASQLGEHHYDKALLAIPVLLSAFGYHNIIPSLVKHLGRKDKGILRGSVVLGTLLALIVYCLWQWLILGSVSLEEIEKVRNEGLPITYALEQAVGHSWIYVTGQIFAFFALTTSFLGVGLSFVDFLHDGFLEHGKELPRPVCSCLTLIPPLICVLLIPALFEKALGIAGGFGVALLNGLLPVLLFAKVASAKKQMKPLQVTLVLFSLIVVLIEIRVLCAGGG